MAEQRWELTTDNVMRALRDVYDPELPVNIVDMGLIYGVDIDEGAKHVNVRMTLTTPGCGMGAYIANAARNAVPLYTQAESCDVEVVLDPPWSPDRLSDDARDLLGLPPRGEESGGDAQ